LQLQLHLLLPLLHQRLHLHLLLLLLLLLYLPLSLLPVREKGFHKCVGIFRTPVRVMEVTHSSPTASCCSLCLGKCSARSWVCSLTLRCVCWENHAMRAL
jgi:hypothetical protein